MARLEHVHLAMRASLLAGVTRRGRTTVDASSLTPEEMGTFIGAFLNGHVPQNPRADIPLAALFRFAVEDLKAYCAEALVAYPTS
jgi:hypothetical protein